MLDEMSVRSKQASSELCLYGVNVDGCKATTGEHKQTLGISPPEAVAPEAGHFSLRGADLVLRWNICKCSRDYREISLGIIVHVYTRCTFS